MTVLLSGFEPFGADDANPSWPAARRVAEKGLPGSDERVVAVRLPCDVARSGRDVRAGFATCPGPRTWT